MRALTTTRWFLALAAALLLAAIQPAHAAVDGKLGPNFDLVAGEGYVSIADGASIYSWGYSVAGEAMQLPGPTLIVTEGQTVNITLTNDLPIAAGNVSIVFPGHQVTATGGVSGALTNEAPNGGTVTYSFVATKPGSYQYHSGTQSDLQVEMGLYGALIVYPAAAPAGCVNSAYNHAQTCYDREYLFLTSEIDLDMHQNVEAQVQNSSAVVMPEGEYSSEYWLLNGRTGPDTMGPKGRGNQPHQPYDALVRMHPGERVLMRVIGAGRENHPFHHHGNHSRVLARDGNLLVSETDATKLAGPLLFTIPALPGSTTDAIFEWTGKNLGWDMYGHAADTTVPCDGLLDGHHSVTTDPNYMEWCEDHGDPIPVVLPSNNNLAFGGFYSGSPYLGSLGALPPGEGGLNPNAGFGFMWHSHTERELVNNDLFPGGLMTMLIVESPAVAIDDAAIVD